MAITLTRNGSSLGDELHKSSDAWVLVLNTREPRRSVCIQARMFADAKWTDVTIRNVSSRGLLLETPAPLKRGTYLEVRQGSAVVVARAVWTNGQKVGARTQDIVLIDRLLKGVREIEAGPASRQSGVTLERRTEVRPTHKQEQSKAVARASEFTAVCAFVVVTSGVAASLVYDAMAKPFEALTTVLHQ